MCDFYSTVWRLMNGDVQMFHAPHNSHSKMIEEAGWRANQPFRDPVVFEAEGTSVADLKIRSVDSCPERLVDAIKAHYRKLEEALSATSGLDGYFSDYKKYSDVFSRLKTLPDGFKFRIAVS